jgi:release factor glutamine methyltransferase
MSEPVSIAELWSHTAEALGSRHEARWLLEVATALDGAEFDAAQGEHATVRTVAHLDSMVARYRSGEPLQYVLGRWGFRHLDLAIDRRVLIPRPETELVAEVAIELPIDGTTVWITDASSDALDVARANLAGIGRTARNVHVGHGHWFEALPPDQRFDVIVSNPPYVADGSAMLDASVADWEPSGALFAGADGLDDITTLVIEAPHHLERGGWLVLEIGADQGDAVADLYVCHGYEQVEIRPDYAGHDRIALGRAG